METAPNCLIYDLTKTPVSVEVRPTGGSLLIMRFPKKETGPQERQDEPSDVDSVQVSWWDDTVSIRVPNLGVASDRSSKTLTFNFSASEIDRIAVESETEKSGRRRLIRDLWIIKEGISHFED